MISLAGVFFFFGHGVLVPASGRQERRLFHSMRKWRHCESSCTRSQRPVHSRRLRGLGRHESRQRQASEHHFVFPVGHSVIAPANDFYLLPTELEEKVTKFRRLALGAALTVTTEEQVDFTGVNVGGPFQGFFPVGHGLLVPASGRQE